MIDSCSALRTIRAAETSILDTIGITRADTRSKSQIRGGYSFKGDLMPESKSVTEGPNDTVDDVPLRMPDTTGNVANLAAFKGQVLELPPGQQRRYTKLHFFGTTTDGDGGGEFTLTYTEGPDQKVTVAFPDWCQSGTPDAHIAIGPVPGRYTTTGEDGAPCSIFHVVRNPDPARTLRSVTLPSGTSGGGDRVAHLMALTLEGAESSFTMPYLDGVNPYPNDGVAPTTSGALAGTPDTSGWHRTPPTLTIGADDGDGSGVERIQYRVNGGPGRTYSGPVAITDEGDLNIEYRAYDRAGNPSAFKSIRAKVDATAPATSAVTYPQSPPANGWNDSDVKVTLGAQDGSGSGVTRTEYRVGEAPVTPYADTFAVGGTGTQVVQYRSVDAAGNEEPWKSMDIRVDTLAPTTTVLLNGAAPVAEYVNAARVAFTRSDGEDSSGAVSTEYRVDGGAWKPYEGAFDLTHRQVYQLDFRSTDQVGNVENYRSVRFTVRAPTVLEAPRQQAPSTTAPKPFAAIADVSTRVRTLTALRAGRFRVNVSCQGVRRGKLIATVTRAIARKLKLKSSTLASKTLDCGEEGRATVSLRPSSAIRTRLARTTGSVQVKLTLRMTGAPADTQTVTLKGKS
ncbi:hypothetical protein DVA67_005470 [Solirubrobacter sp. CPCC 204708]|uniref:Ig-like domain-containing protein n=1 Tax=Solirubrobacter deserti TaxID=2282478 RepID=A0ABT4RGR7_9ACTN|nr:hypothetical protein [Solirubrobacter deserti]MBE2315413.1 hypothetical protein [Solirubrobacter deserti]MDA0137745.1 hypothetical protein [Solirubrobacter deserti]